MRRAACREMGGAPGRRIGVEYPSDQEPRVLSYPSGMSMCFAPGFMEAVKPEG